MKKMKIFILLLLIAGGLFFWMRFISTKNLIIKEYAFKDSNLPSQFIGKKIVQFSDLHYGSTIFAKELDKIVNKINSQNPDLIFFTGDLVDKDYTMEKDDEKILIEALSNMKSKLGKYAVKGNHDYDYKKFNELMSDSGFELLVNDYEFIYTDNNIPIVLAGVSSPIKERINFKTTFDFIKEDETANYFTILLAHEPDTLKDVRKYHINLMFSGHSHGGQVRLPLMKALVTPKGSKVYYEEHYLVDETNLYVSSGIGTSKFKIRFFNRPSINLIRLYDK